MVIALVAIGVVTVGFTTWVGLLSQRGRTAEIEEHATRRRIAAYNSRSAIREYALERMITSSGDSNGMAFDPLSGWSVTSAAAWSGYPMESNTRLAGLNAFSLSWDYPYSKVIDTTAASKALGFVANANGRLEEEYTAISSYLKTYVRSRSPVLGGDLLVVHRSKLTPEIAPVVSGNILVYGRVMHFLPEMADTAYTARSSRFIAPPGASPMNLRPLDLEGDPIPPANMAWTPISFGRVAFVTDLTGKLNVIDDVDNGGNSLRQRVAASSATIQNSGNTQMNDPRGYDNDGNGLVTITPSIGPSNPADLPSVIIDSEVSEIIIEGQEGSVFSDYALFRPAFAVVYVQDEASVRQLTTVRLRKQNSRRLLLAIKQNGNTPGLPVNIIVEDSNANSEWHVVVVAENTPLTFSADVAVSSVKLYGGLQTDSPLAGPGGGQNLSVLLENDTRGLIRLTPRAAWVETIMPDLTPSGSADNTW
jgi:hypothetical protein